MSDSSSETIDALIEADPAEPAQQTDVSTTADSSPADGGANLLDSVTDALKDAKQEPSPSSGQGQTDPAAAPKAGTAEEPLGELTEQELHRFGPKTQRRIKSLLGDRAERDRRIEQLSPKAEQYERFEAYTRDNRLSPDDVATVFELASLIRNDPFKAWERVQAIQNGLAQVVGQVLPPDIQERVKLGYLSEQDGRELAAARSKAALTEAQSKEQAAQAREERERQTVHAHVESCRDTANSWETAKKVNDPDWNEKQARIGELIELEVHRNGYPKTKQAVVTMLDGFLDRVNKDFARFKPKPREVRPAVGSASSRATAQPKTLMEAVDAALAQ